MHVAHVGGLAGQHKHAAAAAAACCLVQSTASSFTPLMELLQQGLWADAKQLLSRGDCNVNARGAKGETALLLALGGAAAAADVQLVAMLLAAGAAADVQQPATGNTPLMLAIRQQGAAAPALVRALLPACSSSLVAAFNAAGDTAALLAAAAVLALPPGAAGTAVGAASSAEQVLQQLLQQQPLALPADTAAALLQRSLAGGLSDGVTALIVSQLPVDALASCSVDDLMACRMFASAAALVAKQSGRAITDALVSPAA